MIKKIKNFTKKVLSFTLATCLLLSVIPMENIKAVSDVPELDKNDWKLSLSFYDSSYMDGRKALESIDWDASDGSYGDTIGRTIITQISYSNENVLKDYKKGELEIRIPDLTYNNNAQITTDVSVGANKEGQEVYNWDYVYEDGFYIFRNANDILANENFEGTIQIAYSITPKEEDPEKFLDSCIHSFNKNLKAILNNTIESNEVSFNYERTYTHPWQKTKYKLTKDKKQLKDLDNLPPGNNDYVWVQYDFTVNGSYSSKYPFIGVTNMYIKDPLPNGCIVLDENYKEIDSNKLNYLAA